jgi:hypothetical protein
VEREDFCETCGAEAESLFHVAFECFMARSFWQSAKEIVGIKIPVMNPSTWTLYLLGPDRLITAEAALVICGFWSLWSGRSARKHGKEKWNPRTAVRNVYKILEDMRGNGSTSIIQRRKIQ